MSKKTIILVVCALVVVIGVGVLLYVLLSAGGPYSGTVTVADTGAGLAGVSVSDGRTSSRPTKTAILSFRVSQNAVHHRDRPGGV